MNIIFEHLNFMNEDVLYAYETYEYKNVTYREINAGHYVDFEHVDIKITDSYEKLLIKVIDQSGRCRVTHTVYDFKTLYIRDKSGVVVITHLKFERDLNIEGLRRFVN
ncbi:MAG: hypothetical protein JEZ08_15375 [Clostridiales bacterium]|nr:hypothetical protein [Clostridiales bacterium]